MRLRRSTTANGAALCNAELRRFLAQGVDSDSRIAAAWAAHAFADGYFGAAPTLSPARAAGKALEAINSWLFSQGWSQPDRPKARVDFGAVLLIGRRLGFVTTANRTIYLWRKGKLLPLVGRHRTISSADSSRGVA